MNEPENPGLTATAPPRPLDPGLESTAPPHPLSFRDSIREGVMNELTMQYDNVVLELNSEKTDTTKAQRMSYKDISTDIVTEVQVDPITFESGTVTGYKVRTYIALLDKTDKACIVRDVQHVDFVLSEEELLAREANKN